MKDTLLSYFNLIFDNIFKYSFSSRKSYIETIIWIEIIFQIF